MCTVEKRNEKEHVFVGDYLSDNYVQRDIAAVSTPESGTTAATDTVAPKSHSFCSPASFGRSLLSSTVDHQRDAFMRLEIGVNSTQFIHFN